MQRPIDGSSCSVVTARVSGNNFGTARTQSDVNRTKLFPDLIQHVVIRTTQDDRRRLCIPRRVVGSKLSSPCSSASDKMTEPVFSHTHTHTSPSTTLRILLPPAERGEQKKIRKKRRRTSRGLGDVLQVGLLASPDRNHARFHKRPKRRKIVDTLRRVAFVFFGLNT